MGLRYVWEKWNRVDTNTTYYEMEETDNNPTVWSVTHRNYIIYNNLTVDSTTGRFIPTNELPMSDSAGMDQRTGYFYVTDLYDENGWRYGTLTYAIIDGYAYGTRVLVTKRCTSVEKSRTVYSKGSTSYGNISSGSSGAYPANSYSGNYWYISKGSDTIDPVSVSYSSSIQGGQTVAITINPSTGNVYGGTIKYKVEYQLNGGSWKVANSGTTNTNLSILVPAGTQTFRARATASDDAGFTSTTTVTGATVNVVNNAAPVINCETSSLGEIAEPFSVTYSVSDEDGDTMTITEKIDGTVIRSYSAPSGSSGEQTFSPNAMQWLTTLNSSHTATITADDGKGGVTTHSISFTRAVHTMTVTLEEPMETDAAITKCVVNIARNLPADAEWSLLVTNNAFDPEPVWEDITQYVKNGWNWVFENQTVTSGRYGFNFKLTCTRGASGQGGYVDTISGGFE